MKCISIFSPIVVYDGWLEDYEDLFIQIDHTLPESIKKSIQAECIFLTHNKWQHERNLANGKDKAEQVIWQPQQQEAKSSQYGSEAVRYRHGLKAKLIQEWTKLHQQIIPWNTIRYIF